MDNISVQGIAALTNHLERLNDDLNQAAFKGVEKGGEILRDEIAARAPVRSGRLKRGIQSGLTVESTPNGATATLESDVPYDVFVDAKSQHYERGVVAAETKVREAVEQEVSNAVNR